MISFGIIKFLFNCFLRFEFCYFCFTIDTDIFNPLFKVREKFRNMLPIFNEFWWKIVSFVTLVYSDRPSVSDLIGTGSFQILFDSSYCFSFNYFNYSCCRVNMACIVFFVGGYISSNILIFGIVDCSVFVWR